MRKAAPPRSCTVCHGTGWEPADSIIEIVYGHPHPYTTYRPCTHHWSNDDPRWDLLPVAA